MPNAVNQPNSQAEFCILMPETSSRLRNEIRCMLKFERSLRPYL
jgi:hypothetical protein